MGVNKAELQLQDKVIRTLASTRRDLDAIKTIQPIGADVLKAKGLPGAGYGSGNATIAAGNAVNFSLIFTPASQVLTLWNFSFTLYIDILDDAYQYPSGSSLTDPLRNLDMQCWHDWADSSDITNSRVYKVRVVNHDTNPHTYYIKLRAYLPTTT